jgi:hypothetical protein
MRRYKISQYRARKVYVNEYWTARSKQFQFSSSCVRLSSPVTMPACACVSQLLKPVITSVLQLQQPVIARDVLLLFVTHAASITETPQSA